MLRFTLLSLLVFFLSLASSSVRPVPFAIRISCGARENVQTSRHAIWYNDFGYTGGFPANAVRPSLVTPPLYTLRYFPPSEGPESCYVINGIPEGHYMVRIFFGILAQSDFDNEPLFDISVEGTLIHSLKSGWTTNDEQSFLETLVFLMDGTVSICFHSTGHGDPAIISIEILQIDDEAYHCGPECGKGAILKTISRLTCGTSMPTFDENYSGDHWGGDRYWQPIVTFGQSADKPIYTKKAIKQVLDAPNFYPGVLYQTAIVSTDSRPYLTYTIDVDPNKNYSIWLHFAEIDPSIRAAGERIFDVLINGRYLFEDIDILKWTGDRYTALVLSRIVAVSGRRLTLTIRPKSDNNAIVNAIEIFQVIAAESEISEEEEDTSLPTLKKAIELLTRLGRNVDMCVPEEHPRSEADFHSNKPGSKSSMSLYYNAGNRSILESLRHSELCEISFCCLTLNLSIIQSILIYVVMVQEQVCIHANMKSMCFTSSAVWFLKLKSVFRQQDSPR